MCDFGEKYAIGNELKAVLQFLHGYFPDFCAFSGSEIEDKCLRHRSIRGKVLV